MCGAKRKTTHIDKIDAKLWKNLTRESTVELVRRIVEESDRLALSVLLETRKLFRLRGEKQPLLLPEFLLNLRNRLALPELKSKIDGKVFADCVYDLTMAKYSNFPEPNSNNLKSGDYDLKGSKVDCRNHYRAFLREIQRKIDKGKIKKQEEEELYAGKILQNRVYNNFSRSKQDCKRDTPFSIRYTWKVKGTKLILYYPSHLTSTEFKKWLEENIKDVDFRNPFEQDRIQSVIDEKFDQGYHVFIDDSYNPIELNNEIGDEFLSAELEESQMFVDRLGRAVAQKKIEEIQELRPGIAKLGEKTINQMILQIFSDLSEGAYSVTRISNQYSISKPTLSRFAGSKWFEKIEESEKDGNIKNVVIPDLWKNTAEVLSGNPDFMEKVLASGFAGVLKTIIDIIKIKKGEAHVRQ